MSLRYTMLKIKVVVFGRNQGFSYYLPTPLSISGGILRGAAYHKFPQGGLVANFWCLKGSKSSPKFWTNFRKKWPKMQSKSFLK